MAELATIATVAHYVESIFSIYDLNKDGRLSGFETMSAFPRFRGFLAQSIFEKYDEEYSVRRLKSIFAFLVRTKKFPEKIGEKSDILWESRHYSNDPDEIDEYLPEISIDRDGILAVLVMLNSSTTPGEKNVPVINSCQAH